MIRSMSDQQLLQKYGYDKEPWTDEFGGRKAFKVHLRDLLEPRPECIPSPDPKPWVCSIDGFRANRENFGWCDMHYRPRPWGSFIPDPEFVRSEANHILSEFRYGKNAFPVWLATVLDDRAIREAYPNSSDREIEDARKVLTRLRDVMEASK